ncbi:MAG: alkyldihydroxyacetonephosphate synthase [Actinomycetota bacterium]|nr:alkyldihydroxyacetonephosphate synthase [Actinomycetota bacterium]
MAAFELDHDPTRWGRGSGDGLTDAAQTFLVQQVGVGQARQAPGWDDVRVGPSRLGAELVAGLARLLGADHVLVDDAARRRHAGGLSYLDLLARRLDAVSAPDAVVLPGSEADVTEVLAWCEANGVAAVTFGGGTSVVGGLRTGEVDRPSIMVSMARLDDVLDVDVESHLVTVGAGITGPELERILATRGLTLGHFPQSWQRATIGGYAATRSAGQSSTGYGRSDEMVESMVVVTPRGTLRVGRVAASAAGPDLRALMIGSEGAFGVITQVTLRVRAVPAVTSDTAVVFPDYEAGLAAFRAMAQSGATADVMRLSDPAETAVTLAMSGPAGRGAELLDRYLGVRRVREPSMAILGWEGTRRAVAARRVEGLGMLTRHGAVSLGPTVGAAWRRHRFDGPFLRDDLMDAGYLVETLETATHWSRLTELRSTVESVLRAALADEGPGPYVMSHVSHVYDTGASLYVTVLARQGDDPVAQWRQAKAAATDALVAQGATITHHHGVGRDHAPWLNAEVGSLGVDILQSVKQKLDPAGVLNPGVLGLS